MTGAGPGEHLRALLRRDGILGFGPDAQLAGRDGAPANWMFYSWPVTSTAAGLELAAREVLAALAGFESTQLAAYGYTAMPLVSAAVLGGGGRYTGLCVRPARKPHGARRQVDGDPDPARPVVVVDDSLSSGTSFRAAAAALESAGLTVEGLVALVHFPHRGGRERAEALGYRVATRYDIWADLRMPIPRHVPGHLRCMPRQWSADVVPDGLPAATAARRVAEHLLTTGEVLRPPAALDRDEDARGGTWVSFRRRGDDLRLARDGFWHFDPADADAPRDLVLAAAKAARALAAAGPVDLDRLKLCVTFFPALERVRPAGLDFSRYGVVVRSEAWPVKVGGALPNTQVFTSTAEQLRHARRVNAGVGEFEPYELYRHDIVKRPEPGQSWPAYGEDERRTDGWTRAEGLGERLVARARAALAAADPPGGALPADLVPPNVCGVSVTLYSSGVLGCSVAPVNGDLEDALRRAARSAARDRRFPRAVPATGRPPADPAVVVSLLHDRERLGALGIEAVARKLRHGRDSLSVHQGDRAAVFLESVVCQYDWTDEQAARALLAKAGITDPPYAWVTYKTASWLGAGDRQGVRRLAYGVPERSGAGLDPADVPLLAGHLAGRLDPDGWPAYRVHPTTGRLDRTGTAARCLHGLDELAAAGRACGRADWQEAAAAGLRHALAHLTPDGLEIPGHRGGPMADACLLAAASRHADPADVPPGLADRLRGWLRPDGSVRPAGVPPSGSDPDFLPGAVLLALARYARATGQPAGVDWPAVRAWYARRFRLLHPWGLAAWHAQLWAEVAELTGDEADAELCLELADWMAGEQLEADGSYLTDLDPTGASFHTAFVAEGVAAAWQLTVRRGDAPRAAGYERSWRRAMGFVDRLVVRPEDCYWMPEPAAAVGGVRGVLGASELRVDYTSHALQALLAGARAADPAAGAR